MSSSRHRVTPRPAAENIINRVGLRDLFAAPCLQPLNRMWSSKIEIVLGMREVMHFWGYTGLLVCDVSRFLFLFYCLNLLYSTLRATLFIVFLYFVSFT